MAKNIETILEEPQQDTPSAVRLTEENAMKNPLFQEALSSIKDPKDRAEFLDYFRRYLSQAYQNNPALRRMMKSYDLSDKINDLPEEAEDHRQMLSQQAYGEPGRTYHYINNFMGDKKTKKGMLERAYHAIGGITSETWKGFAALGGWYFGTNLRDKAELGVRAQIKDILLANRKKRGIPEIYYQLAKRKNLLNKLELIKMPSLYLIGGYILYKTIAYFVKRRRERLEFEELEKMEKLRQGVGVQNQALYRMATAA